MSTYIAPFTFDYQARLVVVDAGVQSVSVPALYAAIKAARMSPEGMLHDRIGAGSGLVDLGGGAMVGLTVKLDAPWQLRFAPGNYSATVTGGNLVGGLGDSPVAYAAGVQVLLQQSTAATVVSSTGATPPTAAETAAAVWSRLVEGGLSAEEILRVLLAPLAGKSTGTGTSSEAFLSQDGSTERVRATFDAQGNRVSVTVDGA
jgi:hypothetical protein